MSRRFKNNREYQENFISEWKEIRNKGRKNYIINHVIKPSIFTIVVVIPSLNAILDLIFSRIDAVTLEYFIKSIVLSTTIGIMAGILGGLSKWKKNEKKYFNTPDDT